MASTSARLRSRRSAEAAAVPRPDVRIVRAVDTGPEIPFATDAAPDLLLQLFAGRPFIRARAEAESGGETEKGEESSHPLRLKGGFCIARK
jgi:hypothetical protein